MKYREIILPDLLLTERISGLPITKPTCCIALILKVEKYFEPFRLQPTGPKDLHGTENSCGMQMSKVEFHYQKITKGKIYKLDPKDGKIMKTIEAPSSTPRGLAWDGKYLWCVDSDASEVIQFSSEDGTTIRSFRSPSDDPRGLAFDGTYLWISDRMKDEIYMVDPRTGAVILITDAPGEFTTGLCYDGKNLWAVDYQEDKLYQLKIRDGEKFKTYNSHKAKITYTHQVTNFGPGNLSSADIHIAIPKDRPSQDIVDSPAFNPQFTDKVTDKWGQETAHYHFENIGPGDNVQAVMTTIAEISEIRYFIYPEQVGKLADIPAEIKKQIP